MRRRALLALALSLLAMPAHAQPVQYRAADGLNNTPVSKANPLPVNEATDVTAGPNGTGGSASCGGTITTAGVAQVFIPAGTVLRGYLIQNQSTGYLFTRSLGAAATLQATQDQNSFRIGAGGYWNPPVVSSYGYTIVGPTAGAAFHCLYW